MTRSLRGWALALCWCLAGLGTVAWAAGEASAPAGRVASPMAGQRIAVGVLGRFPPFYENAPSGQVPEGFDAELMAEIAATTGLSFAWRRYETFAALQAALQRGEVRVITAVAQTASRSRLMRFTRPYAAVQQGIVGPAQVTSVPATPDLSGRRLAVIAGFASETIASERFPDATRLSYPTLEAALDAVAQGEADFVLEALPALRALIAERPSNMPLAVLRSYGYPQGYVRLATAQADEALATQLDAALARIERGKLGVLQSRWLPRDGRQPRPGRAPEGVSALRVAYLAGDRPYSIRQDDGSADGIGIHMMKRVAEVAGLSIEAFVPMTLDEGLSALREGRVDVMLGLTDIAARREYISFVGPYRSHPLVIVSRRQYPIWGLAQLTEQRVGVIKGYFAIPYLQAQWPTLQLVECRDFEDCGAQLQGGRVNALIYGLQGTYERLGRKSTGEIQITGTVAGLYDEHNLGLSRARAPLAPLLRDALNVVLEEEMPAIEAAWSAAESAPRLDWERILPWLLAAAGLLTLLGTAWWLHSRRLRREIGRTREAKAQSEHYLAFLAHEVRNSLQGVSGAATLLASPPAQASAPEIAVLQKQRPLLDALQRSTRGTLSLLDGLLDRHRLHAGQLLLDLRPEALERVLRALIDELLPMAAAKGLGLRFEPATSMQGWWRIDALRLQQIVRNLLVNALKFSQQGEVLLRASMEADPQGRPDWRLLSLEVVDQGPGLTDAARQRLFQRYAAGEGDRPGSGLGLHLCRDLAAALGGDLSVDSQAGRGSTFALHLSVEAAQAEARPDGQIRRALVVEDSPVYALVLQQAFESQGVSATLAETVTGARELLAASVAGLGDTVPAFDLVLSDVNLADGPAEDLLSQLNAQTRPGTVLPPVYCMTAQIDEERRVALLGLGARTVMSKEFDVPTFVSRVLALAQAEQSK